MMETWGSILAPTCSDDVTGVFLQISFHSSMPSHLPLFTLCVIVRYNIGLVGKKDKGKVIAKKKREKENAFKLCGTARSLRRNYYTLTALKDFVYQHINRESYKCTVDSDRIM